MYLFHTLEVATNCSFKQLQCRFTKSVIKSQAALTYAEAQSRIDDTRLHDVLSTNLRTMNRIAKILRRQRTERYDLCYCFVLSPAL